MLLNWLAQNERGVSKRRVIRPLLLAISYILLSFVSFPGVNAGWVAWFSFIPILLLLERYESRKSFVAVFISVEWIKWILLVLWLRHVSWFAVLGIAFGFTCYHLLWFLSLRGVYGKRIWSGIRTASPLSILGLACLWSAMEWLRTQPYGLTGAHLCITQWQYPLVLQIVAWVGGYGLSGVIVAVNLFIAQFIGRLFAKQNRSRFYRVSPAICGTLIFTVVISVGSSRLKEKSAKIADDSVGVRIGVIQPYCPAYRAWTYERMTEVIRNTLLLSRDLAKKETLDFMVWPEGTLPGSIYPGSAMEREVLDLVKHYLKIPLVFGNQSQADGNIYNSVIVCVPGKGILKERYHKRILVPFGEFIPFREYLGPVETIVPIPQDFSRGKENAVLSISVGEKKVNISSQICYEDCFPELLLQDDLSDIDLVFVATYNVWYGEEFGAYFHAAHSVIRAVEIARPVLRCGSAGWSGLIDERGVIRSTVRDTKTGSIYFRGSSVVEWQPQNKAETIYKKYYAALHFLFLGVGIGGLAYAVCQRRKYQE